MAQGLPNYLRAPIYRFLVKPEAKFDAQQAIQLVNSLLTLGKVAFQIITNPVGIFWEVVDLSGNLTHSVAPMYDVKLGEHFWDGHLRKVYPCYRSIPEY